MGTKKNTTEVIIDGKIYQLSGTESDIYMQQVASYLNAKIAEFKKSMVGYNKYDDEIKALLLQLNICDDLFESRQEIERTKKAMEEKEKEAYSAKHDLINMQMKLEATLKQLEQTQKSLSDLQAKVAKNGQKLG